MQIVSFGEREVIVSTSLEIPTLRIAPKFITLLPAFNHEERNEMLSVAIKLIELGCGEFCCVGLEAEQLHEELDNLIEDLGLLHIATTSDENVIDACEYFLFGAGGQEFPLLALIYQHSELLKTLISTLEAD